MVTEVGEAIVEGVETNNVAISSAIEVRPAYRATVSVARTTFNQGESIPFTGRSFKVDIDGDETAAAPREFVTVRVLVNGTRRVLPLVFSDRDGTFSS